MRNELVDLLGSLIVHLDEPALEEAGVLPWTSPVPVFGDPMTSHVATLGINPSSREFVDQRGRELEGTLRRFHTLGSLGLNRWADAETHHVAAVARYCLGYFHRQPYDTWFKKLDYIIAGAGATYYGLASSACHLDLVPYATEPRWAGLNATQRALLLELAGETFATLVRHSTIEVLVLNGHSVIKEFERVSCVQLETLDMPGWTLPRRERRGVRGRAKIGVVRRVGSRSLGRSIRVLGFNHNLQSSFGVTREVIDGIRVWVSEILATTCPAPAN